MRQVKVDFYEFMEELVNKYGRDHALEIIRILLSIEEN
jgi:hypothetical protein